MTVCKLGMDHEWKLVLRKETNSEPLDLPFSGIQFDWVWLILIALILCVRLLVQPRHCILRLELMPKGRASHVSTRQPRLAATREINVHSAICTMRQIRAQWPEEFVNIHVTALKKECLSWKLSETFNLFSLIKLWPVTYFSAILYNRTTVMSCSGNSHFSLPCMWHAQWGSSSGHAIANPISEALNLQIVLVMNSVFLRFILFRSVWYSWQHENVPYFCPFAVRDPQFPQGLEAPSSSGGPGRCAQGFTGRSRKASIRAKIDHQIPRLSSWRASEHFVPGAETSPLKCFFCLNLVYRFGQLVQFPQLSQSYLCFNCRFC